MEENMEIFETKQPKKEKKKGLFLGILIGVLAGVTIFTWLSILGVYLYQSGRLPLIGIIPNASGEKAVDSKLNMEEVRTKLGVLEKFVGDYFLFDAEDKKLEAGIYAGYMNALGDPYSVYYTAEEYQALIESTSGEYSGIGAMVNQNAETKIIKIVKVFAGSPGEEAGLLAEDIIYKVDDMEVTGMDLDLVVGTYIKGEAGTKVKLTVIRGDDNEEVELEITRRKIEVPTVEFKILENDIGYISVMQFDTVTADQFKNAIDTLEQDGAKKLIIDLRNNPGGVLDGVVAMLDYMLPDGLLVYTEDRNGEGSKYYSKDGHQVDLPLVLLVNGNSASASEVFAGAIKDYTWGLIVGTKTFGKGIVQNVIGLGDGTAIKLTTQHFFTPSGYALHGKGIEPDEIVELEKNAVIGTETDNQLQRAVEYLK